MKNIVLIHIFIALLSGCAASIDSLRIKYEQARITTTSLSDVKAVLITPLVVTEGSITKDDSVYKFKDGKSYFKMYELPEIKSKYLINIQSLGSDFLWGPNGKWYYPIISMYDSEYKYIGQLDRNIPTLIPRKDITSLGMDAATHILEGNYNVDITKSNPRYLIVHTSPFLFNFGVTMNTRNSGSTYMVGSIATYVPSDGGVTTSINPFSPFGKYELLIVPEGQVVKQLDIRYKTNAKIVCMNPNSCTL